jgi:hypothetical protein
MTVIKHVEAGGRGLLESAIQHFLRRTDENYENPQSE